MIYGDDKVRNMSRSILPSKSRKTARHNAALVKRMNRRKTRQTLHVWSQYEDYDEFEGFVYDYDDAPAVGHLGWWIDSWKGGCTTKGIAWDRRDADKIKPIMRWAKAIAPRMGDTPVERYFNIKKFLPDNLIGRHALGHIMDLEEYDIPDEFDAGRGAYYGYLDRDYDYDVQYVDYRM